GGILVEERDGVHLDVGVLADHVRVSVVPGVLRVPPRVAHPHDPGQDERETEVRRPGREDLPMRGLVREEGHLGEQDAQGCGDQQLEPAVAGQEEGRDAAGEAEQQRDGDQRVEDGCAAQQTHVADDVQDLFVRTGHRREFGIARVGVADRAGGGHGGRRRVDNRKSTRLNSSHVKISYAVFCLKKKNYNIDGTITSPSNSVFHERTNPIEVDGRYVQLLGAVDLMVLYHTVIEEQLVRAATQRAQ